MHVQVDLHGLHVEEALRVLEQHLLTLGGLGCPGGVLLQVRCASLLAAQPFDVECHMYKRQTLLYFILHKVTCIAACWWQPKCVTNDTSSTLKHVGTLFIMLLIQTPGFHTIHQAVS